MSTTVGGLNKAIIARLRGTEVLTGQTLAAQVALAALVPKWRLGTMTKEGALPTGTFYEDSGIDAMPRAIDVGILQTSVRRFEVWTQSLDDAFFTGAADALEHLFDERRGATKLTLTGDGRVYESSLFVGMQGPLPDDSINAHYGLIAFKFVEARPF